VFFSAVATWVCVVGVGSDDGASVGVAGGCVGVVDAGAVEVVAELIASTGVAGAWLEQPAVAAAASRTTKIIRTPGCRWG
jgi:hypothetical protein